MPRPSHCDVCGRAMADGQRDWANEVNEGVVEVHGTLYLLLVQVASPASRPFRCCPDCGRTIAMHALKDRQLT